MSDSEFSSEFGSPYQVMAKPRVPAAALTHLFKEYEVQVRATNVRDLFDRMQITELNRLPRTRKQSRRRQHA